MICFILVLLIIKSTNISLASISNIEYSSQEKVINSFSSVLLMPNHRKSEVANEFYKLANVHYTLMRASLDVYAELAKVVNDLHVDNNKDNHQLLDRYILELNLRNSLIMNEFSEVFDIVNRNNYLKSKYDIFFTQENISVSNVDLLIFAWLGHRKVTNCIISEMTINLLCNYLFNGKSLTNTQLDQIVKYRNRLQPIDREKLINSMTDKMTEGKHFSNILSWNTDIAITLIIDLIIAREILMHLNNPNVAGLSIINHLLRFGNMNTNLQEFRTISLCGHEWKEELGDLVNAIDLSASFEMYIALGSCYSHSNLKKYLESNSIRLLTRIQDRLRSNQRSRNPLSEIQDVSWWFLNISEIDKIYDLSKNYNAFYHSGTNISRELFSIIMFVQFNNRMNTHQTVNYLNNIRLIVESLTNDTNIWYANTLLFSLQVITMPELRESINIRIH